MYYGVLAFLGLAISYTALKAICSIAIFPGQIFAKPEPVHNFKSDYLDQSLTFFDEKTTQNRLLKAVKIEPIKKSGHVIIIFHGQKATFRNENKLRTYCQLVKDTGHTVIAFDYGGTATGRISTWSYNVLVNDGLHLALKTAKTLPKNGILILKGHSLGGAIATKVAKRCHEPNINVRTYLWNDRSFKSVSAVMAGYIQTLRRSGHYENKLTRFISKLSEPIISLVLRLAQFEINIAEDYKTIPSAYKNYYLIRSKKINRYDKKDDVIVPHCATLESNTKLKNEVKKEIETKNNNTPENITYYHARRKVISTSPDNAHSSPENKLFCQKDNSLSAYTLFCQFSTKYIEAHEEVLKNSTGLKPIRPNGN